MDYKEQIGKRAYYVENNLIKKDMIVEARESYELNTGSDRHGRLLDPKYEYRFYEDKKRRWFTKDKVFFSKEEIIERID